MAAILKTMCEQCVRRCDCWIREAMVVPPMDLNDLEVRIVRNATSGHCAMRETRDIGDVVADQMEADSDAHYWSHNPSGKNF